MQPIDLRSDTVTRPSAGMRQAMARAEVGDDVLGEDPTLAALQDRVAALLGKEAALFVPSGTMSNQVALGALTRPGDEVICDANAHCVAFEAGAMAALWGVQPRTIPAPRGLLAPEAVEAAIRAPAENYPRPTVLAVENTHNRGGGAVYPLPLLRDLAELALRHRLALHMDGARLWNACAATGRSPADYAAHATTVSVCLSKGLGAPVGSVVAGPREVIADARRLRRRLGGGMRQGGVLAAAGLYALDHNLARLPEDHENARLLAERLGQLPGASLLHPVETNLVFVAFAGRSARDLSRAFGAAGVLASPAGSRPDAMRFVTHLDVTRDEVLEAAGRMAGVVTGG
ncbi:MAG TPA: GntG family PLP-dependent aldolase [Anaeromyxobacteraceae bacterium]|nr:GntG family PLP-dependent aldolase [Anaeromyxobacteraceae bacterium]